MVKRELVWEVSQDGMSIVPATPQDGGVQGDHNVTRVIFKVAEGSAWADPANAVYIECDDGAGNIDATEQLPVVDGKVSYLLPRAWTQYGGVTTLRLVAEGPGVEGAQAYSPYASVRFESRQNAMHKVDGLMKGRLAHMEQQMTEQMKRAEDAADGAAESARQANVYREGAQAYVGMAHEAAQQAVDAKIVAGAAASSAVESSMTAANSATAAELAADRAEDAAKTIDDAREVAGNAASAAVTAASAAELAAERAERAAEQGGGQHVLRFTVEKDDRNYTSSKTFQEIIDAVAAGKTVICVLENYELPLTSSYGNFLVFAQDIGGSQISVAVSTFGGEELITVNKTIPRIQIGDQIWGGDDEEYKVDFTDTINDMIDNKVWGGGNLRIVNARDYGAIGDGKSHPLSERYPTLEFAKADYPCAESLDDEIDGSAIQKALHYAEDNGLPLYIPAGNYLVSKTISTYTRDTDSDKQSKVLNIYGAGMGTTFTTTEDFDGEYVFYIDSAGVQPQQLWVHDFAIDLYADASGIYFNKIGMKSVVENLWVTFKYEKDVADTNVRAGIFSDHSTVATFQRIKVFGSLYNLGNGPRNCGIVCRHMHSTKIIDCDVVFCKWGIYMSGGSNNLIEYCRIDENEYGVFQNSSTDYRQELRAYVLDESPDSTEPQFKGTFGNLTIRKNRFESNNQQAIFLAAYSNGTLNYMWNAQITIADNYFSGLGTGTAMHTSARGVFRKAIWLYRCKGVVIDGNYFKGQPYDADVSDTQNIYGTNISDGTLQNNVAITWPNGKDDSGNTVAVKSSTKLAKTFIDDTMLVDNLELQQTTRQTVTTVNRCRYVAQKASGTLNVSSGVHTLNDGVTVSGITIESDAPFLLCQEVTLVANGAATVKHTAQIRLKGGVDFVMGVYDTLTLVRIWCNSGLRWVEKSRSVYAEAATTA